MSKYKPLTTSELSTFEKEFVQFLVVNGIDGKDWQRIKSENTEEAQELIDTFSDVVWESILRNVRYLDFRTSHSIKCFQCLENKITLVGMDSVDTDMSTTDFLTSDSKDIPEDIKVYTTDKAYSKSRELEIYDMMGWGCERSEGDLFKLICMAL